MSLRSGFLGRIKRSLNKTKRSISNMASPLIRIHANTVKLFYRYRVWITYLHNKLVMIDFDDVRSLYACHLCLGLSYHDQLSPYQKDAAHYHLA